RDADGDAQARVEEAVGSHRVEKALRLRRSVRQRPTPTGLELQPLDSDDVLGGVARVADAVVVQIGLVVVRRRRTVVVARAETVAIGIAAAADRGVLADTGTVTEVARAYVAIVRTLAADRLELARRRAAVAVQDVAVVALLARIDGIIAADRCAG